MINLLPWREQQKQRKLRQFLLVWLLTLLSSLLSLGLAAMLLTAKINSTAQTNQRLQLHIAQLQSMQQKLDIRQQQQNVVQFLAALTRITPGPVYLVQLSYDNNAFLITGHAVANADLGEFIRSIGQLPGVKECVLLDSNQTAGGNELNYKLRITLQAIKNA